MNSNSDNAATAAPAPTPTPTPRPTPTPALRRRRLRRLVLLVLVPLVLGYVTICAGIYIYQDRLIYFPNRTYHARPSDYGLPYEELTLTTDDSVAITAWFVPHAEPVATALYLHGNAENLTDLLPTVKTLHLLRCAVLAVDYRGYGTSTGQPSEDGTYRDAEAAWQYLVGPRGLSPQQIVVIGRSLGGAVAIELAARHPCRALVVECSFTSLVDIGQREYWFLPVSLLARERYESIRKVPQIRVPKLFMHGTSDELIPLENARRLYAAAAEPKQFVETPGGHNTAGFEYSHETRDQFGAWLANLTASGE